MRGKSAENGVSREEYGSIHEAHFISIHWVVSSAGRDARRTRKRGRPRYLHVR